MNQIKIGKFISLCRKNKKLTQNDLAEKLNITDRAVSKWETGKGMPDASIMIELCNILDINVNELLSGEKIENNNYDKKAEENLLTMKNNEEIKNKSLMLAMWAILISTSIFYITIITISMNFIKDNILLNTIIIISTILFLIANHIGLKFELDAGYYECKHCHNKFIPSYKDIFFGMHLGTTRYLKCNKCNKHSFCKKVLTK